MAGHRASDTDVVLNDNLLFSTENLVEIPIVVDTAARDTGNTTTTNLRRGLVLAKVTATGRYKEFDTNNADGTQLSTDIVILSADISVANGHEPVMAYHGGDFNSSAIIVEGGSAAPTWTSAQRLVLH